VKEIVKSAYEDIRSWKGNKLKATIHLKIAEFFLSCLSICEKCSSVVGVGSRALVEHYDMNEP